MTMQTAQMELPIESLTETLEEYIEKVKQQAEKAGQKKPRQRNAAKAAQAFREFVHHCGYTVRVYEDGRIEYPD